jgi:hypothetical protein
MSRPAQQGAQGAPTTAAPVAPAAPQAGAQAPASVEVLLARRNELSNQLNSADARRQELVNQLRRPNVIDGPGLQQRIQLLDDRILQIEQQIAENGRQLANTPPAARSGTLVPPDVGRSIGVRPDTLAWFGFFLMMPIVFAWARRIWRRPAPPALPAGWDDTINRIERIEHAVDAIAIEVERVAEGQRFMTRVMTDAAPAATAAAPAGEPRALPAGEAPMQPLQARPADEVVARNVAR